MSSLYLRMAGAFGVALILAGCAARKPAAITEAKPEGPRRRPACPSRAVIRWSAPGIRVPPRGVSGDFQSLTVLRADGTMAYETQLKIGRKTRPALRESGCWTVADGVTPCAPPSRTARSWTSTIPST